MIRSVLLLAAALLVALGAAPVRAADNDLADLRYEIEDLRGALEDMQDAASNRLNLNGYYDFEYNTSTEPTKNSHFRQHHISLFATRNWANWRLFSEIEFEDGTELSGSGTSVTGNGQVKLENAWLEYVHNDYLNVRMGKILTPQHWNVNHYPHAVLTTERPLVVRKVFPVDFTGIKLHGNYYTEGHLGVTYHVYVANGESANESKTDNNENKAVGGRLIGHFGDVIPGFTRLDVGASHYSEKNVTMGAHDVSGIDAQIAAGPFELLFEFATHHQGDHEGFYIQPSVWVCPSVQAVYRYDYFDDGTGGVTAERTRHTVGADWRPMPNLSFKASVDANEFDDPAAESFESLHLSVAVYF